MGGFDLGYLIMFLFFIVIGLFLMRLFGAWMLRIDEVIKLLKEIKELLKK